jgi:predicted enzyme related to lactoylglutathione lyase
MRGSWQRCNTQRDRNYGIEFTLPFSSRGSQMRRRVLLSLFVLHAFVSTAPASAQLLVAKDGPIVYGHHHLNSSNLEASRKFWVDTLGGTLGMIGTDNVEVIKIPNALIFMRNQKPTGPTKGTTLDHVGFSVPNLRATLDRMKANGYKIITAAEAAPKRLRSKV